MDPLAEGTDPTTTHTRHPGRICDSYREPRLVSTPVAPTTNHDDAQVLLRCIDDSILKLCGHFIADPQSLGTSVQR